MKPITFIKMVASGNDFVVVDNRKRVVKDPVRFAREVCARHTGIGADGVLLLEDAKDAKAADFKMRILNADGSEAEACGNGYRCVSRFAHEKLGMGRRLSFETLSGTVLAELGGDSVKIRMTDPSGFQENQKLHVLGRGLRYAFLNTGVPHAVLFVEGVEKMEVEPLGRAIRQHEKFAPRGTNVNFVEVKGRREIHVRTYERGVEAETLACGTGAAAAAVVSALAGYAEPPVAVKTRGGETLRINFRQDEKKITAVTLEGGAAVVYEGKVILNHGA